MQKEQKLNNGDSIPTLGLGTWEAENGLVGNAIKFAITEAGYRHLDCASVYGNEEEIGEALTSVFGTSVEREELFVTSKLWGTDHRPEDVEKACKETLSDLRLEYLDLYLMHFGIALKKRGEDLEPLGEDGKVLMDEVSIQETWQAMEKLVAQGLVKSIGVANFSAVMLVDLLTYASIKPAMNQIELHPYNTQTELIDFCKYKDIAVTAYSPLARQGVKEIKGPKLFDEPVIQALATKYKKTSAQILLNWAVSRGTIAIPKSTDTEKIAENIDIFDFELAEEEKTEINSLNKNRRLVDPMAWWGVPYFA